MSYSKKELRLACKRDLLAITDDDYQLKNLLISKNLLGFFSSLDSFHQDKFIGAYAPLRDEPDWSKAFETKFSNTAFPKLGDKKFELIFIKSKLHELEESCEFGSSVLAPVCRNSKDLVTPDFLLVPGLAFNKKGERLGRGKGFYDRYLENFKGIKIGICFNEVLIEDIPSDDHDEVVDYVVTDLEILKIKWSRK